MFTDESRFEWIRAIDDSVYTGAVERDLRTRVSWKLTVGVGKASWFGQGLPIITLLVFLEFGRGRGRGLNAQHYIDQVLRPIALPFIVAYPSTVLQQDNACPHAARLTQNFLTTHNVPILPWPALSPKQCVSNRNSDVIDTNAHLSPTVSLTYPRNFIISYQIFTKMVNTLLASLSQNMHRMFSAIPAYGAHSCLFYL